MRENVFTTYTDVVNVNIEGTCKEKHSVVVGWGDLNYFIGFADVVLNQHTHAHGK